MLTIVGTVFAFFCLLLMVNFVHVALGVDSYKLADLCSLNWCKAPLQLKGWWFSRKNEGTGCDTT